MNTSLPTIEIITQHCNNSTPKTARIQTLLQPNINIDINTLNYTNKAILTLEMSKT